MKILTRFEKVNYFPQSGTLCLTFKGKQGNEVSTWKQNIKGTTLSKIYLTFQSLTKKISQFFKDIYSTSISRYQTLFGVIYDF